MQAPLPRADFGTALEPMPEAVKAFRAMQSCDESSDAWWEAHNHIYDALEFMPWEWPIFADVEDGGPCPHPEGTFLETRWHHRRRIYEDVSAA